MPLDNLGGYRHQSQCCHTEFIPRSSLSIALPHRTKLRGKKLHELEPRAVVECAWSVGLTTQSEAYEGFSLIR